MNERTNEPWNRQTFAESIQNLPADRDSITQATESLAERVGRQANGAGLQREQIVNAFTTGLNRGMSGGGESRQTQQAVGGTLNASGDGVGRDVSGR